ncbi:hypothetical protein MNBD_CHLOROFLEXI01-215, partial [hydrothermal vent metagenome]
MSFDWRTEEDDGWQDEKVADKTAVGGEDFAAKWYARWWLGLLALLGIAAVWWVVQWQIGQRVTAATSNIEAELVSAQNFLLQTAVSRDEALFRTTLSGRNPDWGEAQKILLEDGLLLERPMFDWQYMPQSELTVANVSVELSPDLRAAELIYSQDYIVQTPAG